MEDLMTKTGLLDFTAIRDDVSFDDVLAFYEITVRATGPQVKITCPFHEDGTPSCSINREKGNFNCFGCPAKGNVLDFIGLMEGYTSKETFKAAKQALVIIGADASNYRKAENGAEKPKTARRASKNGDKGKRPNSTPRSRPEAAQAASAPVPNEPKANPVLDLELKLIGDHPFLTDRGVTLEQAKVFGIGFCSRGMMRNRIAIPLHNVHGELVAYVGRYALEPVPEDQPKYKQPKGFEKSLELFNLHRAKTMGKRFVVLVEGFWSTLRLHDNEIPAVALMGTNISQAQAQAIVDAGFTHAILILDGDEAGRVALPAATEVLSQHVYIKTILLPDGVKPDTMDEAIIHRLRR
jgi:DNA primase